MNTHDELRSKPDYESDPVEQLAFELAFELEDADLSPNDYVTVNREKLRAIARRILERLSRERGTVPEGWDRIVATLREFSSLREADGDYWEADAADRAAKEIERIPAENRPMLSAAPQPPSVSQIAAPQVVTDATDDTGSSSAAHLEQIPHIAGPGPCGGAGENPARQPPSVSSEIETRTRPSPITAYCEPDDDRIFALLCARKDARTDDAAAAIAWAEDEIADLRKDRASVVELANKHVAEIERLRAELARTERNRDMWKDQCKQQAEKLTVINSLPEECVNSLTLKTQVDDSGELVGINHQAVDEIHTALVKARFTVAASPVPQNGEG